MKRALTLILITAACIAGFLSIKGVMPFMPIFGSSMEPTLHSGALLIIKPIDAKDVKVGDIIVYNVPTLVREHYNYPPVVAHRVKEIIANPTMGFRTQGDNTAGEEPFTIRPQDLRGTVGKQIPYLGLPLLFFQSQQGLIFIIVALSLLALFLYGGELSQGGGMLHRGIFSPVIAETKRTNRVLTRKIEATDKKMDVTEQALEKFAAAIAEYAQHLASHTSAIQSLAEASHELKNSAAEQNKVISYLAKSLEQPGFNREELSSRVAQAVRETEKPAPRAKKLMPEAEKVPVKAGQKPFPQGCARTRRNSMPSKSWRS